MSEQLQPAKPPGSPPEWHHTVYAEDQPEYEPLPVLAHPGGIVVSLWQLDEDDRRAILDGARVYLQCLTFGRPLQPVRLWIEGVGQPPWIRED